MKRNNLLPLFAALCALVLAGCSTFEASVKPGTDLSKYRRVWVKSNMNDNRGIGNFICVALRARGIECDMGPLTMLPHNMQAIISFNDSWAGDYQGHMSGLTLSLKDVRIDFPIATATYTGHASFKKQPHEIADRLVGKLFDENPDARNQGQGK